MANNLKRYSELQQFTTFKDRYNYLRLNGEIGLDTFGHDRYLNQMFYRTPEWKRVRDYVIIRDNGCDLGIPGLEIGGKIIIHHLNPITKQDVLARSPWILDPEFLITTTMDTHNAIHYGTEDIVTCKTIVERKPNDTTLWRSINNG